MAGAMGWWGLDDSIELKFGTGTKMVDQPPRRRSLSQPQLIFSISSISPAALTRPRWILTGPTN